VQRRGGEGLTDFGVLGTLSAARGSERIEIRGPRVRALLALLLVHANQLLTADRIIDLLWGGDPPRTAANTVQTHIVRLRKALASSEEAGDSPSPLRTVPAGYVLDVEDEAIDSERFERLLAEARRAVTLERHAVAYQMFRNALAIWRGPAFVEFASEEFAYAAAIRLNELRVDAEQESAAAALACGRIAEAISALQPLVAANPLREQPVGHLMVALYRAGRQGDALSAYRTLRVSLREELGLDPSHELQRLERLILEQAPDLELVALSATRPVHALPAAALVSSPRFVGRTEELAWLGAQWQSASRGEPLLAIIQGEPGIGKTRIAAEFAERCYRGGTTILWGRCIEEAGVPFEALSTALGPLVGTVGAATPLPHLFGLLDERAAGNDPDAERNRMFQLVTELLERTAADAPVLMVIDDMQWVDLSTLALLAHFLRAAPPVCILILATVRATELSSADAFVATVSGLRHESRAAQLEIRGFEVADVQSLVANLVPAAATMRLGELLQIRTGGNPFFVTALLRQLGETDGTLPEELDHIDLPDTVRGVIDRRVALLDPAAREILEVASVAGVEFDSELISEVTRHPSEAFATLLDRIDAAGIAQLRDGNYYLFSHSLVRDAIYRGIGAARRSLLHNQLGVALERRSQDDREDLPAQLAHHFAAAGTAGAVDKAINYSRRAGEGALGSLAYEDACSYFDMALDLIDGGHAGVDQQTRADVLFDRARALFASGERARAKTDFDVVASVYRGLNDPDRLTKLALGISGTSMRHLWTEYGTVSEWLIELIREALAFSDGEETPGRVRLLARLAEELYFSPDAEERSAIADQALAMGRRLGDPRALADALNGRLRALWHPANSEERLPMARELCALAARIGDSDLAMAGEAWAAVAALELGLTSELDDHVAHYAAMTNEHQSPHHRVWALALLGGRALARGEFGETERLIEEGMSVAPEVFGYAIQGFAGQLCTLRIEQGRAAEVLDAGRDFVAQYPQVPAWRAGLSVILGELGLDEEAREQVTILTGTGLCEIRRDQEWLFLMGALAETCSLIGARDVAAECYELLTPFADRCIVLGDGYVLWCSVEKSLGLLAHTIGRAEVACGHLERALAVHRELGAPPLVARTSFELARALHFAGAGSEAVARRLEFARDEAAALGQYGLLRRVEIFSSAMNEPLSGARPVATRKTPERA
jgi:DNA-binding SARP family transcriptional activator